MLVVYGTGDASMPTIQGAEQIIAGHRDRRERRRAPCATTRAPTTASASTATSTRCSCATSTGWVLGLPGTGDAAPAHRRGPARPDVRRGARPGAALVRRRRRRAGAGARRRRPDRARARWRSLLARAVEGRTDRVAAAARRRPRRLPDRRFARGVLPLLLALGLGAIAHGRRRSSGTSSRSPGSRSTTSATPRGAGRLDRRPGPRHRGGRRRGAAAATRAARVRLDGGQPAPGVVRTVVLWSGVDRLGRAARRPRVLGRRSSSGSDAQIASRVCVHEALTYGTMCADDLNEAPVRGRAEDEGVACARRGVRRPTAGSCARSTRTRCSPTRRCSSSRTAWAGTTPGDLASRIAVEEFAQLAGQAAATADDVHACFDRTAARIRDRVHRRTQGGTTVAGVAVTEHDGGVVLARLQRRRLPRVPVVRRRARAGERRPLGGAGAARPRRARPGRGRDAPRAARADARPRHR